MSPLVLAIETATGEAAAALADGSGLLAWSGVARGRRHVETLHPAIDFVCRQAETSLQAVDAVVVDIGPGLFTGLRVGVTAANSLGYALGIPVYGVTSLQVLATAAGGLGLRAGPGPGGVVVPVIDMRRGEVAWPAGGDGEPRLGSPADLACDLRSLLEEGGDRPVLLAGDGAKRYEAQLSDLLPAHDLRVMEGLAYPPATVLAGIGVGLAAGAGPAGAPAQPAGAGSRFVLPLYLREADVAINWETRQSRASMAVAGSNGATAAASTGGAAG